MYFLVNLTTWFEFPPQPELETENQGEAKKERSVVIVKAPNKKKARKTMQMFVDGKGQGFEENFRASFELSETIKYFKKQKKSKKAKKRKILFSN